MPVRIRFGVVIALLAIATNAIAQEDTQTDIADLDLEALLEEPVVTVASRRAQALLDVGASVTVITSQDIERYAITNLAQAMRLVPGAMVAELNETQYNVGFRGIAELNNNRVLVLVDGRNVSEFASSTILWTDLPISPGDVAKIEIIRGPAATIYGANAFSGVISITTKRALDFQGGSANLAGGVNWLQRPSSPVGRASEYSNSTYGNIAYAFADEHKGARLSLGFNHEGEFEENVATPAIRYGQHNFHVNASSHYRKGDLELYAIGGYAQEEGIVSPVPTLDPTPHSYRDGNVTLNAELSNLLDGVMSLRAELDGRIQDTAFFLSFPGLAFGRQTSHQARAHGIVQSDFVFFDGRNTATVALEGYVEKAYDFYDADPRTLYGAVILQDELRLFDDLVISVGGRYEVIDNNSQPFDIRFSNFNPRASVNWRFAPKQSVRFSAGTSYRTPTAFELYSNLQTDVYGDGVTPPVSTFNNNPRLRPEHVTAFELGYRSILADRLSLDVTAYYQAVERVVQTSTVQVIPEQYTNLADDVHHLGIEAGARYALRTNTNLRAGYTGTATFTHGDVRTSVGWPTHIINLAFDTRFAERWTFATLAYVVLHQDTRIYFQRGYFSDRDVPEQLWLDARVGRWFLQDRVELWLAGRNMLAPFRHTSDLRQLPAPPFDAIGATFMVGVLLKESK